VREPPYPANLTQQCPENLPFPAKENLTILDLAQAYIAAAKEYHSCKNIHNELVGLIDAREKERSLPQQ
jgi:hypothetical protein